MVQVFDPGQSTGGSVGEGLSQGISSGLELLMQDKIQKMHQKRQARALEEAGLPGGLAALDPTILREFAKSKAQEQAIQGLFGEESLPGQSKAALQPDRFSSTFSTDESEAALPSSEQEMQPPSQPAVPQGAGRLKEMSDSQLQILQGFPAFKDIAKSELDMREKATTAGARTQENRYKSNLPIYRADQKKLEALEAEDMSLERMNKINNSGKLPGGLGRWNVDFEMGELRIPFAANPETQSFVKLVNDFTVRAKESFGARVTNFELKRFMKRLPSLLNTTEGRRSIIRQMEIVGDINQLNKRGILDAFDKAGGLRKLDYDQAERISKRENKGRINELKKEYASLEKSGNKIQPKKAEVPAGSVEVISPDGKRGHIPKSQLKNALKAGYKRGG